MKRRSFDARPRTRRSSFRPVLEALENRITPVGESWALMADPEGYVFVDNNGNGVFDAGESAGGPGWTVFVDANENGALDTGETSTATDATGHYSLILPDGTYSLRVVPQSGFQTDAAPLGTPVRDFASVQSGINADGSNNYSGLAWANGSLYATFTGVSGVASDNVMYRIDPVTGAALGPAVLLPDEIFDITFDGTDFWGAKPGTGSVIIRFNFAGQELQRLQLADVNTSAVEWDGSALRVKDLPAHRICRIDPSGTGTILDSIPMPNEAIGGIAFDGTFIWVVGRESNIMYGLDPATGAVQRSFKHQGNPGFGMAIHGQYLWLSDNTASRVYQYDLGYGAGRIVTVAGADVAGINLAVFQPASVSGRVFSDYNQNGVADAGEAGLLGWRVYLESNANSQYDSWETSTLTDAAGNYSLNSVRPGTQTIAVQARQPGWVATTPQSATVTLSGGQAVALSAFGEHLNGAGPVGTETRANTTTAGAQGQFNSVSGEGQVNSAAADSLGRFVVVWEGDGPGDTDGGVFARLFNADGTPRSAEFRVNAAAARPQKGPVVAMADNGIFAVGWSTYDATLGKHAVFTRLFTADGTPRTGDVQVSAFSSKSTRIATSIAMDADGDFVVLLQGGDTNGPYTNDGLVFFQRYNALGQAQGKTTQVVDANLINGSSAAALDGQGNLVVAWADTGSGGTIFAQRYDSGAHKLGSRISAAVAGFAPSVARNAPGQFVIGSGGQLQVFDANGNATSGAFNYRPTEPYGLRRDGVAIDTAGNVTVAWPDRDIRAQRFTSTGTPREAAFTVNTTLSFTQQRASVAPTPNGGFVVAWSGQGVGDDSGVFFQRYSATSPLTAAALPARPIAETLNAADVKPLLTEALRRWRLAGANVTALGPIDVVIADLGGSTLGLVSGRTITLDDNAAGWGWFIDRTPQSDSEFRDGRDHGQLGHIDALTVLMHEVGHLLGHEHADGGVMAEALFAGVRELPDELPLWWAIDLPTRR